MLSPYACHPQDSRGRRHPEAPAAGRDAYQRDRDRIIHSNAFRRLEYKTQVFLNHEGDLYRTRLTHSLEVAQLARSVARQLGLNEDLTEAICLAHDLGHTPFGHAGQDALNACMHDFGGFEHNLQSLRVVDVLEERYAEFDGLNLTFEAREGILKHCALPHARELGDVGERFLSRQQPSLEAQIANLADEIAYNHHDIDDGLRSGLITLNDLDGIDLFCAARQEVEASFPALSEQRLRHETIRRMINALITDLVAESQRRIAQHRPQTVDDVRRLPPLIGLSPAFAEQQLLLKRFLRANLYRHPQVAAMNDRSRHVLTRLFTAFMANPVEMPADFSASGRDPLPRRVADWIAGMTDRFASREYERLFNQPAFS